MMLKWLIQKFKTKKVEDMSNHPIHKVPVTIKEVVSRGEIVKPVKPKVYIKEGEGYVISES